jgi:Tfp pilus assembly protein PilF
MRHLARSIAVSFLILSLPGCATWRQAVALHQDPLSADEHLQLAKSYEAQGLKAAAKREIQAALKSDSKHVPALLAAGNVAYEEGDLKEAERYFKRALKRDRINAGTQNNLAMVYVAKGDLKKAERLATQAAENDRMRPYAEETLAQIEEKRGRFDEADHHWNTALAAVPPTQTALRQAIESSRSQFLGKRPARGVR